MNSQASRSLLLVGADPASTEPLLRHLLAEGYAVSTAYSGRRCFQHLREGAVALVILDTAHSSPLLAPWDLFQEASTAANVPWLLLVRDRLEVQRALALGAADALVPPLHLEEVSARIRAILRRHAGDSVVQRNYLYVDRDLLIDLETGEVWVRGERVALTVRERSLLLALARRAGQILPPDWLIWVAWGEPAAESRRPFLKQCIWRLRQKVERDPKRPTLIITHRGEGYELRRAGFGEEP